MTRSIEAELGTTPIRRHDGRPNGAWCREHVGLVAVIVVFVGISGLFALGRPHFAGTDESAHLGYVHELADFQMPTIEGFPPVPASASIWQIERASALDDEHRGVWVASHPPLHYVALVPAIWLAELTDRPDGGLLFIRFGNIAFGALGLIFTYLLAKEVTAVRRIALAATAIAGLIGLAPAAMSLGQNDGSGFAAGSLLLWAGARCLRAPAASPCRRDLVMLAAATTIAAGVRTATMLLAVAVVGFLIAVRWLSPSTPRHARRSWVWSLLIAGIGTPLLFFGWFYLRNHMLYGDVGASRFLLERFDRVARGGVLEMFTRGHLWLDLLGGITTPSTHRTMLLPAAAVLGVLGFAGFLIALRSGRTGDRLPGDGRGIIDGRLAGLLAVAIAVIAFTVAQHLSGGGMAHSRYLFPALGASATVMAIGFDKILPRLAPAMLVGLMAWWLVAWIPTDADRLDEFRQRATVVPGLQVLRDLPGSTAWRALFATMVAAGLVAGAVVLVLGIVRPNPPTSEAIGGESPGAVRPGPGRGAGAVRSTPSAAAGRRSPGG